MLVQSKKIMSHILDQLVKKKKNQHKKYRSRIITDIFFTYLWETLM